MTLKNNLNKIALACVFLAAAAFASFGCASLGKIDAAADVDAELRASFDFFWNEAVGDAACPAYGLVADRWSSASGRNNGTASVASTGFGLAALCIGVHEGYITEAEGRGRASGAINALAALQDDENSAHNGMFYHFLSMTTGGRTDGYNDASTIDTAILICGMLTAGEFFGGEVKSAAESVYAKVNWAAYKNPRNGKAQFSMGYRPGTGLLNNWDWYAEQLMLYVLAAGAPSENYRAGADEYRDFNRPKGKYGGDQFIYSWYGSIFTYQYSHAFIDFKNKKDANGTDWFVNSVRASKAAYKYCADNKNRVKTFSETSWGLTACDVSGGYSGLIGAPPRGWNSAEEPNFAALEAYVAPAGAIGSTVFTPDESLAALVNYRKIEKLQSKYGLLDSYNLQTGWYASDVVGIDKGITALMLSNYKDGFIWECFMKSDAAQRGLSALGIGGG